MSKSRGRDPLLEIMPEKDGTRRLFRHVLTRRLPFHLRREAFLAIQAPPDPRACKVLYAEGIRLLALADDPQLRAALHTLIPAFLTASIGSVNSRKRKEEP